MAEGLTKAANSLLKDSVTAAQLATKADKANSLSGYGIVDSVPMRITNGVLEYWNNVGWVSMTQNFSSKIIDKIMMPDGTLLTAITLTGPGILETLGYYSLYPGAVEIWVDGIKFGGENGSGWHYIGPDGHSAEHSTYMGIRFKSKIEIKTTRSSANDYVTLSYSN